MEALEMTSNERVLAPLQRVSARAGLDPLTARLAAIRSWLQGDLAALERAITGATLAGEAGMTDPAAHDLSVQASSYLLSRPGKRVRPLCVVLAARMGGRAMDRSVKDLAVACELIHTATLLHDDVIDEGAERRGASTARVVFGNAASVLAGDHLLLHALKRVSGVGYRRLLDLLLDTIGEMVTAEALQLDRRGTFEPDRDLYLQIIQGKTAGLFRWALVAGGTAGGLSPEQIAALGEVGNALGLAFQLQDDLLDLEGDAETLGKDLFADLREGKLTWPFIVAAERDPSILEAARAFVAAPDSERAAARVSAIVARLDATGALKATRDLAEAQGEVARAALAKLPAGAARDAISVVIDAAIRRRQ